MTAKTRRATPTHSRRLVSRTPESSTICELRSATVQYLVAMPKEVKPNGSRIDASFSFSTSPARPVASR